MTTIGKAFNNPESNTMNYVNETTNAGFGGSSFDINKRVNNTFNQWTRTYNDECSYVNDMRILRKPLKYYTWKGQAPAPTNSGIKDFVYFTDVGNQKPQGVESNLVYPNIGQPTTLGNKWSFQFIV